MLTAVGKAALVLPFIRRVELHCYHVQGVPRGDADASKQTQECDHPRLAVAEHQEETADTRYDTGSRCLERGMRTASSQTASKVASEGYAVI